MRMLGIPRSTGKTVTAIKNFKGVDLTNSPANVEGGRSPEAPNMIRDTPGKVRKRMGYYPDGSYPDIIYGVFHFKGKRLVHSGNRLYDGETTVYEEMNTARSKAWQMKGKLYILDGKELICYGKFDGSEEYAVKKISEIATVPTVIIGRAATGGGTTLDPLNLLQPKFISEFYGDGTAVTFSLPYKELDSVDKVELKNASGEWEEKTASTHYTVDLKLGTVKFKTAPAEPAQKGTDNVRITASRTVEGSADKINKCTVSILYGVDGAADRLFVGGNPDYPNMDFYSQKDDPAYFGDTWTCVLGQDNSEVIGYSLVGNYLAAHKSGGEDGRNVIMRHGIMEPTEDGKSMQAAFPIVNTIQGAGAVGRFNFAYLNESLFATKLGIYAITAQDITGEKYTQGRSFYIDGALAGEDLENSYAIAWKDFYVLATDKRIYLLDSLQKVYEKNNPYSSYQYECYYWEIPNISVLFTEDDTLCFGTDDGRIMKFYTNKNQQTSYNDDGAPIKARWDTNAMDGELFYKKKNFKYLSASIAPAIATGFEAWAQVKGLWTRLYDSGAKARYFDFTYIDFSKINFSSDTTPRTLGHKIRLKRVDKVRFSFRNEELNEPFGLYAVGTEFTESGNYKQ